MKNLSAATKHWCRQKLLTSTKILRRQNSRVDKNPARVEKNLASTKISRWQKSRVNKMLAQTQKDPLTVGLGRVHSCWLLPDLPEDLLLLPDSVDPFACSCQVWHCFWPPCFYGQTLSRTVPACCTGLPHWKRHKFWLRQNIGVLLKFTDMR